LRRPLKNKCPRKAVPALLLAFCLVTLQCRSGGIDTSSILPAVPLFSNEGTTVPELSRSQEYAAELLSYFMRVVLGQAGRPDQREAWRTRALDQPLDLDLIIAKMEDVDQGKSLFMVMDTNLLGFSKVLYHYDPLLNLFRGRFGNNSIYPTYELISLRMLLAQKIHRREQVNLKALIAGQEQLLDPNHEPTKETLREMGLKPEEYRLLQKVFQNDPQLVSYLHNPFLIESLADVGALRTDQYVREMIRQANYRGIYPQDALPPAPQPAVTIAILPSMTKEFAASPSPLAMLTGEFVPTDTYRSASAGLRKAILKKAAERFAQAPPPSEDAPPQWPRLLRKQVRFFNAEKRPLLIYPQNADRVLADICPQADIAIILLGKNVYRTLDIDPQRDTYPHVNRIYLDIADVQRGYDVEELEQVSDLIYRHISEIAYRQPLDNDGRLAAARGADPLSRANERDYR
jgi:hypothetical protein